MKILYVQQHFATDQGQAGLRGFNLVRVMARRGHDVTVIAGQNWRDPSLRVEKGHLRKTTTIDGVKVVVLGISYSNKLGYLSRIASFLAFAVLATYECLRRRADLIYASSTPLTVGIPALVTRWIRRTPYVIEIRDLWPELPVAMGVVRRPLLIRAMRLWERLTYRHAFAGVGLAPGVVDALIRDGRLPIDRVFLVPNGADTRLVEPRPGRPRRRLAIPDHHLVFGYTGTLGMANSVGAVLDAAAELRRLSIEDISIVIVGEGRERAELAQRIIDEGLSNVHLLDLMAKKEYVEVMAEIDVGMQILAPIPAFAYGTSPQKFFEYLSAGRPVLVNYDGWMADLVTQNECGVAVTSGRPDLFAEAMVKLRADSEALSEMGRRARDLVVAEFDQWELLPKLVASIEQQMLIQKACRR